MALLDEILLPDVRSRKELSIALAELPLVAPPSFRVQGLNSAPLNEKDALDQYPYGRRWPAQGMHAPRFPTLRCVTRGEADLSFVATRAMLEAAHLSQIGGYLLSMPSPSYLLLPANTPHDDGSRAPWHRDEKHTALLHIWSIRFLPVGALCHSATLHETDFNVQYSLFIEDALLASLAEILQDALRGPAPDLEIARAQLLTLFLRLRARLSLRLPPLTDGLHSLFPDGLEDSSARLQTLSPTLQKARDFIRLHLHESLTPALIAQQVRLTPAHLNRLFRRELGITTMTYVTQSRIESARLLLQTSELSMSEISRLVGYRHASHFTLHFQKQYGLSPLQFRQQKAAALLASAEELLVTGS